MSIWIAPILAVAGAVTATVVALVLAVWIYNYLAKEGGRRSE